MRAPQPLQSGGAKQPAQPAETPLIGVHPN
jgi:hypothetical protein